MPEKQNFPERAERLFEITKRLSLTQTFPLLKEVLIPEDLCYDLDCAVRLFIRASERAAGKTISTVPIHQNISLFPNLTQNGVLMPKRENALEYNLVQKYVAAIFKNLRIDEHVDAIQFPAMMRFVDGRPDPKKDSRPYSSTKHHIDLWNGDPPNEIHVFIPVMGDAEKNGIEFLEAREDVMKQFLFPMKDYDKGKFVAETAKRYPAKMRAGFLYLADSYILHRTLKSGIGFRISMEFRFIPKKNVVSDALARMSNISERHKNNYADLKTWYSIGETSALAIRETFEEARQKYLVKEKKEGAYPIIYEDYFRVIPLFS